MSRQQFFVRSRPWNLLYPHPDPGMLTLEVAHQLLHHLSLSAEGPEADLVRAAGAAATAKERQPRHPEDPTGKPRHGARSSHPP